MNTRLYIRIKHTKLISIPRAKTHIDGAYNYITRLIQTQIQREPIFLIYVPISHRVSGHNLKIPAYGYNEIMK